MGIFDELAVPKSVEAREIKGVTVITFLSSQPEIDTEHAE